MESQGRDLMGILFMKPMIPVAESSGHLNKADRQIIQWLSSLRTMGLKSMHISGTRFNHWSAEPFRGLKRDIYEGGHHVPLIIKGGGHQGRSTCDKLVSQIDFMGTIASSLGYQLPDDAAEDSHDILPLLHGRKKTPRTVHVHNTRVDPGRFVLTNGI